jgi:hypothetical protein
MCRAFYFEGLNSVAVGERFGFKPPHIRQMFRRLALLDAQMQRKSAPSDYRNLVPLSAAPLS